MSAAYNVPHPLENVMNFRVEVNLLTKADLKIKINTKKKDHTIKFKRTAIKSIGSFIKFYCNLKRSL